MKIKQVILIRKDLKMRRGKEIAQGAHAAMAFLVSQLRNQPLDPAMTVALDPATLQWLEVGVAKICLRVNSEQELIHCHDQARDLGLKAYLIRDSGRTEFGGVPTLTACAIGPDDEALIDKVTGALTLY